MFDSDCYVDWVILVLIYVQVVVQVQVIDEFVDYLCVFVDLVFEF